MGVAPFGFLLSRLCTRAHCLPGRSCPGFLFQCGQLRAFFISIFRGDKSLQAVSLVAGPAFKDSNRPTPCGLLPGRFIQRLSCSCGFACCLCAILYGFFFSCCSALLFGSLFGVDLCLLVLFLLFFFIHFGLFLPLLPVRLGSCFALLFNLGRVI